MSCPEPRIVSVRENRKKVSCTLVTSWGGRIPSGLVGKTLLCHYCSDNQYTLGSGFVSLYIIPSRVFSPSFSLSVRTFLDGVEGWGGWRIQGLQWMENSFKVYYKLLDNQRKLSG